MANVLSSVYNFKKVALVVTVAVLLSLVLFMQKADAVMTRSETQTVTYEHYSNALIDDTLPEKEDPWIAHQTLVSGSVNVNHEVYPNKNINGLCVGETVSFSYNPVLTYNGIGGAWDTPYGDWCDNTESGCNIDMKNGNYLHFYSSTYHEFIQGKVHWTAIKPSVEIVSDNDSVMSCSDTGCSVVGNGTVTLHAKIDKTTARIWSIYNMERARPSIITNRSKSILGINRNEWHHRATIVSPTDDNGRFKGLDFDYLEPSMWTWGGTPAHYHRNGNKDEKKYDFPSISNSSNLSWEVQVGCDATPACGTKDGKSGESWSDIVGSKCSDTSDPVVTNTDTGWIWSCNTISCGATRTCADLDSDGVCDAVCDPNDNKINDPSEPNNCCNDNDGDGACDVVCYSPQITNPVDPMTCCDDMNSNGYCDVICNGDDQMVNPDYRELCCWDKDHDGVCDAICVSGTIMDPNDTSKCCVDSNNDGVCDCVPNSGEIANPINLNICCPSSDGTICDVVCAMGEISDGSGGCCTDSDNDGRCDISSCPDGKISDGGGGCCLDSNNNGSCDIMDGSCPTGQIVNPNDPTECCNDADSDGKCDCLQCGDGCLSPYIPNQVNLLKGGGAQNAEVRIPAGLWCDINRDGILTDGTEGSATQTVVAVVPITSHPQNLNFDCQCEPSKGTVCPVDKPERSNGVCCSDEEWDNDNSICGFGKDSYQKDVQCVCMSKKCSTSGSCIATPVIAEAYTDARCSSECSSSADCSGGSVIPVP